MKVLIAGGSGFLGRALTRALASRGDDVVILSREPGPPGPHVRFVVWRPDTTKSITQPPQEWPREVNGADAIVNLAGAGIADKRWTPARKRLLRESRIAATRQLVDAVRAAARKPSVFVSASGIGYYGTGGDEILEESSPAGSDFLASLCRDWEAETRNAETHGCRVVIVRNGIALARDGGALGKMLLPFSLGLGGPIASGRQYMSWIHRDDWVSLILWLIDTPAARGPFNGTAPEPVTNAEFTRALGAALHRPVILPMPGFALRLLVGELADAGLINGQRVLPKHATGLGFQFKYPDVRSAMTAAIG